MVVTVPILGKEQIIIGYDISDRIVNDTLEQLPASTYVLVSDTNIAKHSSYASLVTRFDDQLGAQNKVNNTNIRFLQFLVSPGELSKTRATKERVEDFMFQHSCTRDTVVLALGGGVIGDMIGYVAATFMRGVRYVQIPTTLLAMVDSSIGGKTAVDVPAGKNLVGSFWQPSLNFLELRFLETLPKREFLNGMAEVIKTAAIWNATEFDRLELVNPEFMAALARPRDNLGRVNLEPIKQILLDIVQGSVRVKAEVVTLDEREGGLRNILNFGHSIGHAFEAILTPHVLHGECVSIGSVLEAELARHLGYFSAAGVARLSNCFKAYELPVSVHDPLVKRRSRNVALPIPKLLEIMAVDKKNSGSKKRIVLLSAIGKTWEPQATAVSDSLIEFILGEDVGVNRIDPGINGKKFVVVPPGSKSISNRVLVLCALAQGTCRVTNLLHSDDTAVMLDALQKIGAAKVELADNGDTVVVSGTGGKSLHVPDQELYLGNAGTAARFLTAVAALVPGKVRLTGNKRMQERPIGALVDALRSNGQTVDYINRQGSLPVDISGKMGTLKGGDIELAATVSSQYVSALLMVAPYASQPVKLRLVGGKPISQFYIDMTIQMMADFGIQVVKSNTEPHTYLIPQQTYKAPAEYTVESDASSATYPLAFAAMTGNTCTVPTIGYTSLQGDARFAVDVLGRMGCVVDQTATSTTVSPPVSGSLKAIDVDMEPMTDAFLTACVVAAIAEGTTRITGIANQHVKECDRIKAMHDQLAKFGVLTVEGDDGIDVTGIDRSKLLKPTTPIHSYDDHRVAMSLSLLATQVDNFTMIDDRRCVEKTWPGWWDTLQTQLGVKLIGQTLPKVRSAEINRPKKKVRKSIILVGMRGAGKTSWGKAAAQALGCKFLDLDDYFVEVQGTKIADWVENKGWDSFREAETDVLVNTLSSHAHGFVIACGGGIIELQRARQALKQFCNDGLVVHIRRNLDDIVDTLTKDTSRPALGEDLVSVFRRREPLYNEVSNRVYWAPPVSNHSLHHSSLVSYFSEVPPLDTNKRSFFLSLTVPNLLTSKLDLPQILEGCDAVELRADLLENWSHEFIGEQVGALRLQTSLPIIFTVRSKSQGGQFPDENTQDYLDLINLAFDLAIEYVDVELTQSSCHDIVQSRRHSSLCRTKVIASHHDPQGIWDWDEGMQWYSAFFDANRLGDIVKFVSTARTTEDNFKLENFRNGVKASKTPFIGINMGVAGRMSRVFNRIMTPVTHPKLPCAAAPGQLSVAEANSIATALGMIEPLQFFVAGKPIGHSHSPSLHNGGYQTLSLPHQYSKLETDSVQVVADKIAKLGNAFGGASITIPLKTDVISICTELSQDAKLIGAVNTLTPTSTGLKGSNTDWIGICDSFGKHGVLSGENALVIGAGGTALAAIYAFYRMGFSNVYVLNRTQANAEVIAKKFEGILNVIPITESLQVKSLTAALSCVPGDKELPEHFGTLLDSILGAHRGVLLDAAYKPARTPIINKAEELGWQTIAGRQMLVFQGVEQFKLWTGFSPLYTAEKSVE